jgi:hypothetical protein
MAMSDIRIRFRHLHWVGCGLVFLASGCFSPKKPAEESAGAAVASESGVTADEATPRETVNKKTQNVLNLAEALASGGELASGEVAATNPLLQSADAYRTSVAKLGAMAISQAIQIRNAQSIQDPKPLAHAVFMAEIIKPGQPDGIQLAMLPYYQEYAWDETAQELVVVNFPARIAEREKQR